MFKYLINEINNNNNIVSYIYTYKVYIKLTNLLILYNHFLFLFLALKAGILNNPGNNLNPKG